MGSSAALRDGEPSGTPVMATSVWQIVRALGVGVAAMMQPPSPAALHTARRRTRAHSPARAILLRCVYVIHRLRLNFSSATPRNHVRRVCHQNSVVCGILCGDTDIGNAAARDTIGRRAY
ncbi:hypothetical protein XALC_2979 [Xanthomonas albilineans GPE PC73]|uniref:Uncharacterized protein n=1 Tax=Xanthomonas albilineans (strain GPE PC73 / CFBP 7063) TaxID=380358 RepID=D2UGE5_XANAP|nr:hypothetical protein XALC_2979 [Xanthomonas albilineans GPE PC73]